MENVNEKIYCYDRDNSCWPMMAMMNNGTNQWMNNPFAYMIMLALFGSWGGNGFGFNRGQGVQDVEIQDRLNQINQQLQNNQNTNLLMDAIKGNSSAIATLSANLNCDFNTLQQAICSVQSAIQQVGGQIGFSAERVINAVNLGDCGVIQALNSCCCQTQRQLSDFRADVQLQNCQQTSELRGGQRDLGQAITQGFSQTAFQAQQDKCDIIRSNQDNTQRIIDTLNAHWGTEKDLKIQDLKFELSQERQNNFLINRLGSNCGCNTCSCGCGI